MTHRFGQLMFTGPVKTIQEARGSRKAYARLETSGPAEADKIGWDEANFIAARDSFYIATVSQTGWPYVQHRGGPVGFLKVLDDRTIGFADYQGNRQYVSVGNLVTDDRVSVFLMDYPNQRRLKLLGHAKTLDRADETNLLERLQDNYAAKIERGIIISIEAFDWNCPQHITPRHTEAELVELLRPVRDELEALRAENTMLRARLSTRAE